MVFLGDICMLGTHKGFTLVELLVVVLIIGVLVALAVPEYMKAVERSRLLETVTLLDSIAKAQRRKYMQINRFADDFTGLDVLPNGATGSSFYTKGDSTTGENGNGFKIELNKGTSYNTGYAQATRHVANGDSPYSYVITRLYAGTYTTCSSDSLGGQSLCADFCGIEKAVSACCSNGSEEACPAL